MAWGAYDDEVVFFFWCSIRCVQCNIYNIYNIYKDILPKLLVTNSDEINFINKTTFVLCNMFLDFVFIFKLVYKVLQSFNIYIVKKNS